MRRTDISILEHLYNDGRELIDTPADIAANTGFAVGNVRQRVLVLRSAGLIKYYNENKGQYQIDDLGRRYLSGELTNQEVEQLEKSLQS